MADALVKHAFVSAIPEGTDPTKIRPSNWNAALLFSAGNAGEILTRDPGSATGAAWSALTKSSVGLGNVENTALSTWAGSSSLVTLGAATAASLAVTGALTAPIGATGNKTFLQATLSETGAVGHFNFCVGHAANPGDGTRDDHVFTVGYNTTPLGGRATLTEPCFEWRIEDFYAPTASPKYMEAQWQYYDATGAGYRPISCQIDRANGAYLTNATLQLTGSAVSYIGMNGTQYVKFTAGLMELLNAAQLNTNQINAAGNVQLTAAQSVFFASAGYLTGNQVNGQFLLRNTTVTTGVGFDVATDGTLKVRTRGLADTAIVDASRFSVSGVGGVTTFGPAAVTSITVKGGIVTAIA